MNLTVSGGALPTFLLDRIAAATGAYAVKPTPPQTVVFFQARQTPEFTELLPLIGAEGLRWRFDDDEAETE